ncbi:efflux RND transporter periplasmic adaptor subunit [Spirochaetia bacterium 38H-sp]|uniref:Efflux RND transporter periplasmic adaptor subunit n=1 Tax=Rarispira pelagica TaxID=3141764 RepID=A0ABU9U9P1_9SPIR
MKRKINFKAGLFAAILIASIILVSCEKPKTAKTEDKETTFAVATTKAVKGEIINYIELSGDVEPKSTVDAYADTTGKLTKLYVGVGDYVKKGQVIAEVDPSRPGMDFVASPVKAPISGNIIALPMHLGATVIQSMPVAKLADLSTLQVVAYVAERFVSRVQEGQKAVVSFSAFPGESFPAYVSEVSPVVDSSSRAMQIKLSFTGDANKIKPGMFAIFKLVTDDKKDVIKIPANAITEREGKQYIYKIKKDGDAFVAKRFEVITGIKINGKAEIKSGLEEGEEIVLEGINFLDDGSRVKIVKQIAPLPVEDTIE